MNGPKGELATIIGKGTKIDGTITIEGSTRIDGTVTGKLESNDSVTIGPTGSVKAAEIRAKIIIVGGKVEGNLLADEKVELQSKCEVVGDITSKSLLVEHGAIFHGSSNMKDVAVRVPKLAPDILKPEKKE
ncbi:MAG: polymer-forming cytoskeletal protein [Candidatus Zixiibacteriota bacterium]|nr:MAG: polymer-forming cytoskeletal protein [candidate division Zixibacteria bacterium]